MKLKRTVPLQPFFCWICVEVILSGPVAPSPGFHCGNDKANSGKQPTLAVKAPTPSNPTKSLNRAEVPGTRLHTPTLELELPTSTYQHRPLQGAEQLPSSSEHRISDSPPFFHLFGFPLQVPFGIPSTPEFHTTLDNLHLQSPRTLIQNLDPDSSIQPPLDQTRGDSFIEPEESRYYICQKFIPGVCARTATAR
ncbi:hypothetical protein QR685DRAFT_542420 [Neurospora intermedia]|uniref:Uncharacterized protein n=1 Tax=Neurospora intermedia TaxID=5142 RepID=A0ABR3DMP2_NEUIN